MWSQRKRGSKNRQKFAKSTDRACTLKSLHRQHRQSGARHATEPAIKRRHSMVASLRCPPGSAAAAEGALQHATARLPTDRGPPRRPRSLGSKIPPQMLPPAPCWEQTPETHALAEFLLCSGARVALTNARIVVACYRPRTGRKDMPGGRPAEKPRTAAHALLTPKRRSPAKGFTSCSARADRPRPIASRLASHFPQSYIEKCSSRASASRRLAGSCMG